jgi:hypothetical protein
MSKYEQTGQYFECEAVFSPRRIGGHLMWTCPHPASKGEFLVSFWKMNDVHFLKCILESVLKMHVFKHNYR